MLKDTEVTKEVKFEKDDIHFFVSFFYMVLYCFTLYTFLLPYFNQLNSYSYGVASTILVMIIFSIPAILWMKNTVHSSSFFGFNINNYKLQIYDGIMYSLPLCIVAVFLKIFFIYLYDPIDKSIFSFKDTFGDKDIEWIDGYYYGCLIIYILFVTVQEGLIRGCLQTALSYIFSIAGYNRFIPILLANSIFAITHNYKGVSFVLLSFLPGFIWGYLSYKHKSILAPSVSHMIVGVFAIYIVGFSHIIYLE